MHFRPLYAFFIISRKYEYFLLKSKGYRLKELTTTLTHQIYKNYKKKKELMFIKDHFANSTGYSMAFSAACL